MTDSESPVNARDLWVAFESIHAVTYFAPGCRQAFRAAGLPGFWSGYFAARACPLGRVGAGVVTAAFYNFAPAMVAKAVPACWEAIEPMTLAAVRAHAGAQAVSELCGADERADVVAALPLLRRVVAACAVEGRPLAAPNRSLWPVIASGVSQDRQVLAEVWQAVTALREHRGDGHVAALVSHGLSGLEAHLLVVGTSAVGAETLRDNRGWSEEAWQEGGAGLRRRGLLESDGSATEAGRDLRDAGEVLTDQLAEVPWATLTGGERAEVAGVLGRCAQQIQGSGLYPFPNPMGLPELPS